MNIKRILSLSSISNLSAEELSDLLAFLVDHEYAPGGPYLFSDSPPENVKMNAKIYTLMLKAGKKLPRTLEYITSSCELLSHQERALFKQLTQQPDDKTTHPRSTPFDESLVEKNLAPELYAEVEPILKKLISVDAHGEITELLSLFAASFSKQMNTTRVRINFEKLGAANLYTWLAYTLYDTLLDEHPSPLLLPAANCLHRLAVATYIENGVSAALVQKEFNKVDSANALEILYCRVPVTDKHIQIQQLPQKKVLNQLLSGRSSVHYLGLLAFYTCISQKSVAPARIAQILNFYLAARQLNDDIHDWEEDLVAGRITYVVAQLLQKARTTKGSHRISPLRSELRVLFWDTEMEILLNYCLKMAATAKAGLIEELGMPQDAPFILTTIEPIIKACQSALDQHDFNKKFLQIQRDKNFATTEA